MQFRFTLTNSIVGAQVIDNPDGWQDIKVKLERDSEFHSLVEKIEVPLIFYGSNGVVDGGYDYITNVITTQGLNAIIVITIDISEDEGQSYEEFFTGNLELSDKQEFSEGDTFYKLQCPIIQTSLWSKFINRVETPVDLQSTTDLDGNAVDVVDPIELNLPSQTIKQTLLSELEDGEFDEMTFSWGMDLNEYGIMDFDVNTIEEIRTKHNITRQDSLQLYEVPDIVNFEYGGVATIEIQIILLSGASIINEEDLQGGEFWNGTYYWGTNGINLSTIDIQYQKTEMGAAIQTFSKVNTGTITINEISTYTLSITDTFGPGQGFRIWLKGLVPGGPYTITLAKPWIEESYMSIVIDTVYEDSVADALLIHDVFKSAVERITGEANSFYSERLGRISHGYDANGCNSAYANMKGLHIRGYLFSEKPFFQSVKQAWDGANPIFNLGLGYEDLDQSPYERVIRIEEKSYFYNETISVNLDYVDNIKKIYDKGFIFKSIAIGYEKWSAESSSGIDDPQTKKHYATIFQQIGENSSLLSNFFAAALGIEQTRRNRADQAKDWRLDDDTMIIALDITESPDGYWPEFNQNFPVTTNMNNTGGRYNLRLTPAYNFLRWIEYFKGCLQSYTSSVFRFTSGEGNYAFASTMDYTSDCILPSNISIAEDGDISVDIGSMADEFLHLPDMYEFNFKLSWQQYKTIRNNRNKAIGVSQSDAGHETCFISLLEWSPTDALADFKVWLK